MIFTDQRNRNIFISWFGFVFLVHGFILSIQMQKSNFKKQQVPRRVLILKIKDDPKNQIIQSQDSVDKRSGKNPFLSDKNRSFKKQTQAKTIKSFSSAENESKVIKDINFSDLGMGVQKNPFNNFYQDQKKIKNKKIAQKKMGSSNDYLPNEIPLGDVTELNTAEYKYFGYYQRIREKLEYFWGQTLAQKIAELARKSGFFNNVDDYITGLNVTLNSKGEIIRIEVESSSGVSELDDAAFNAFSEAGPFSNPPRELLQNGKLLLRWGFVVRQ